MLLRSLFNVVTVLSASMILSACMTGARVVSSQNQSPTIRQAQAEPYNGAKQRVVVRHFDYRASGGGGEIGRGMSDMLVDSLFNTNRFIVLERDRLIDVTEEQDLQRTGRFRRDTAVPLGQMEAAQFIINGSVTSFEPDCRGGSVILYSGKQSCITINLRVIDATTGRIVHASTVEGKSASNRIGLIFTTGNLPLGLGAYSRTPMEEAVRQCIETAVQNLVSLNF